MDTPPDELMADSAADPAADPVNPAGAGAPVGLSGLVGDIRLLASDARTFAEAEVAYQATRARLAAATARNVAILGLAAFVLAFFALGALTVGLILALTPLVTAWGATAIVAGALVIGAMACVGSAVARIKRLSATLRGPAAEPGE